MLDEYERECQKFLENEGIAGETSEFSKVFGLYNDTYLDPVVLRSYIENVNFISEIPLEL